VPRPFGSFGPAKRTEKNKSSRLKSEAAFMAWLNYVLIFLRAISLKYYTPIEQP